MTTLVTGASGHLGANLVRALLDEGEHVRVLQRKDSDDRAIDGLDLERVAGDLRDPASLERAVQGCARVYHLAAFVSLRNRDLEKIFQVNVHGTRYLMDACLKHDIERVVHCSSFGTIGTNPNGPSDETCAIGLGDHSLEYERSKTFAEYEVMRAVRRGLDAVVVNPSGIVGPWDYKPSFLGQTIIDFARRKMHAFVPGAFDFVPVRDVVQGHLLAMEHGQPGRRYLLSGSLVTIDQVLDWLAQFTGVPRPRLRIPPAVMERVAVVKDWAEARFFPDVVPRFSQHSIRLLNAGKYGSNRRARQELGLQPTEIKDAFRQAVEWFYAHGFID